jgi:hypothetical protein
VINIKFDSLIDYLPSSNTRLSSPLQLLELLGTTRHRFEDNIIVCENGTVISTTTDFASNRLSKAQRSHPLRSFDRRQVNDVEPFSATRDPKMRSSPVEHPTKGRPTTLK